MLPTTLASTPSISSSSARAKTLLRPRLPIPSLRQCLLAVLVLLQALIWFGEGGWRDVWRLEAELQARQAEIQQRQQAIEELEADIQDLQAGTASLEERARYEMGLMKPGERFVQFLPRRTDGAKDLSDAGQTPAGSPRESSAR